MAILWIPSWCEITITSRYVGYSLDQPASINSRFSSVDNHTRSLTAAGVDIFRNKFNGRIKNRDKVRIKRTDQGLRSRTTWCVDSRCIYTRPPRLYLLRAIKMWVTYCQDHVTSWDKRSVHSVLSFPHLHLIHVNLHHHQLATATYSNKFFTYTYSSHIP